MYDTAAIPNLVLMEPNHQVTFVIFTGIILNFASRQVIILFILGIADDTVMVDGFIVPISALPEEYQKIARKAKQEGHNTS